MSVLQEANKAIDEFVKEQVSCNTCIFFETWLIGGVCKGPELSLGYMEYTDSMCEQHYFKDSNLQNKLEKLQEIWVNAWEIRRVLLEGI